MSDTMWIKRSYNHGGGSNKSKDSKKFKSITKKKISKKRENK